MPVKGPRDFDIGEPCILIDTQAETSADRYARGIVKGRRQAPVNTIFELNTPDGSFQDDTIYMVLLDKVDLRSDEHPNGWWGAFPSMLRRVDQAAPFDHTIWFPEGHKYECNQER